MFGHKVLLILMSLLVAACQSCAHAQTVPDDGRPNMSNISVGKLEISDGDGDLTGTCTIWKATDNLAVTAGHCCSSEDKLAMYVIKGEFGTPGDRVIPLLDNDDDGWDVCVMSAHMRGPSIELADHDPPLGSTVWVVGYPHGYFMMTDGFWSKRDEKAGWSAFSIDGTGGYSGSAVVDTHGKALTVLSRGYLGRGVTLGMPLEHLRAALRKASTIKVPSEEDIVGDILKPDESHKD